MSHLYVLCIKNEVVDATDCTCCTNVTFYWKDQKTEEFIRLHRLSPCCYSFQKYQLNSWDPVVLRLKKTNEAEKLPPLYYCYKCNHLWDVSTDCLLCHYSTLTSHFIQPVKLFSRTEVSVVLPVLSWTQPNIATLIRSIPEWLIIKPPLQPRIITTSATSLRSSPTTNYDLEKVDTLPVCWSDGSILTDDTSAFVCSGCQSVNITIGANLICLECKLKREPVYWICFTCTYMNDTTNISCTLCESKQSLSTVFHYRGFLLDRLSEKYWHLSPHPKEFLAWYHSWSRHYDSCATLRSAQQEAWTRFCPDLDEIRISRLESRLDLVRCLFALYYEAPCLTETVIMEEFNRRWKDKNLAINKWATDALWRSLPKHARAYLMATLLIRDFRIPTPLVCIIHEYENEMHHVKWSCLRMDELLNCLENKYVDSTNEETGDSEWGDI